MAIYGRSRYGIAIYGIGDLVDNEDLLKARVEVGTAPDLVLVDAAPDQVRAGPMVHQVHISTSQVQVRVASPAYPVVRIKGN